MAKWHVDKVYSGQRLANGCIDFEIDGDVDGTGVARHIYTWNPAENGWPMADHITALLYAADAAEQPVPIADYVWQAPTRDALVHRLKTELRRLNLRDYVEREISTGGDEPVPADIAATAAFARAAYNNFKASLPNVPEDWEAPKYWRPTA